MYNELIKQAISARERAYAPYSHFMVGAALLAANGEIYSGCNIENSAFSPSCCAERVAFYKAIENGAHSFSAIAVVGGAMDKALENCPPCGVCRQVMKEFCNADFKIILATSVDNYKIFTLAELLPEAFK
ncbi:MAG: cytidine deaminase [Clostridia bacterium]